MRLHLGGVRQWVENAFFSSEVDIEVLNGFWPCATSAVCLLISLF